MKCLAVIALTALAAAPVLATEKRIKLTEDHGTYSVPVLINGTVLLNFIVDTGASGVTIPGDVGLTLVRSGSVGKNDLGAMQPFTLADGSTSKQLQIRFNSLQIGSGNNTVVARAVVGSVGDANASMLLGGSFLQQFKSTSIDHSTNELVNDDAPNPNAPRSVFRPAEPQAADLPAPQRQPNYNPPTYQQPYYPQPYYPPPYYAPPAPCPGCVVGGILGGLLGGALLHRGYGGWGGYRGGYGYRGWHR